MTTRLTLGAIVVAAAFSGAACTVSQADVPPVTGPSVFATSLNLTAHPDTLVLNGQQSVVIIDAQDANGAPLPNLRVHLDIVAGNGASNCGRLSLTDVTTGPDGKAGVVFTAPSLPLPLPECANGSGGVTIVASPVGTNAQATKLFSTGIRFLTPSSVPGGSVFAVNFSITPNPGAPLFPVTFADAGSVSPGHSITTFQWNWSDGATKTGPTVTHDFNTPGVYTVTLTITDDAFQSGSKTALVTIN